MADDVGFTTDTEYVKMPPNRSPSPAAGSDPPPYQSQVPNRYRKRNTEDSDKEVARDERRAKARETRRTRRTIKLQQQQQEQKQEKLEPGEVHAKLQREGTEVHLRVDVSSESDASSVDENFDVASLAESIEESLT